MTSSETKAFNLKDTLNLPQTDFPIRAGLTDKEPELLKHWETIHLDKKIAAQDQTHTKSWCLHDGPPYPNGPIHMGHALNKVLKDILIKKAHMSGFSSTYIPGWDCHGLPIETQVIKELKAEKKEEKKSDISWFRNRCKEFALDYVKAQKEEFKRLGVFAQWDTPYLTLNPHYEAEVIKKFGNLAENGLIYKGRKPIHWCMHCETALAEAEIEYEEKRSPSIFVKFTVKNASKKLQTLLNNDIENLHVAVWTTTPWTLPSNVAIAAHPDLNYIILNSDKGKLIIAKALKDSIIEKLELDNTEILGEISGTELEKTSTQHPFFDRTSDIVLADYVSETDGTGFVHIAPGHGQDDYIVGQKYGLPTIMPVNEKGCFTNEVEEWVGINVFDANKAIGEKTEANGKLLFFKLIKHSYPHCWRCKNPVIFRATEQWFIGMDKPMLHTDTTLREEALKAIKTTKWFPEWGETRITTMIENRPDWCISRQRYWGIPIPVFTCKRCNHSEMTGSFNKAVYDLVKKEGTMGWFSKSANEILSKSQLCSQCGENDFKKESDILDVWFESGASFASVLQENDNTTFPADMYLEGSDQHRGWFQSSLLISLGSDGYPPFKSVLTHGFLVDEKGHKMSKSKGNVIAPQKVIEHMGSDVLRWWIASSDFKNDISISQDILKQAKESFGKVRNTIRFCLSNLYDYKHSEDKVETKDLFEVDQWGLMRLNTLIKEVEDAFKAKAFHVITQKIHDFCSVSLSSTYLDITKDNLYCNGKTSKERRSTQTALHIIADTLIRLTAPILVFTAEDAYTHFNNSDKTESVHLEAYPEPDRQFDNYELDKKWTQLLSLRDQVFQELEQLRAKKEIGSNLEAKVKLSIPESLNIDNWSSFFIVSQVEVTFGDTIRISTSKAEGEKCERCWKLLFLTDNLCSRCHNVVKN